MERLGSKTNGRLVDGILHDDYALMNSIIQS